MVFCGDRLCIYFLDIFGLYDVSIFIRQGGFLIVPGFMCESLSVDLRSGIHRYIYIGSFDSGGRGRSSVSGALVEAVFHSSHKDFCRIG